MYGVCRRTSQSEKSGKSLSGSGKTGAEVAYSWIFHPDWLLSVDDVLYNNGWMDAALFLSYCNGGKFVGMDYGTW